MCFETEFFLQSLFEKSEAKRIWTREEGFFRLRCRLFYTCRPAGAWVHGVVVFLHTFRPSGAFKGWCAVRTLQMYFSNKLSKLGFFPAQSTKRIARD